MLQGSSFYPDAVIVQVYDGSVTLANGKNGLGWVRVNLAGYIGEDRQWVRDEWDVDALLVVQYASKPTTDETQSSSRKLESPLNQQYGMITPPRRGDKVIVGWFGPDRYFVMGVYPAPGGSELPSYTSDDLSYIHRSGASIRFNDKYPGVTAPVPDEYDGITGAMSIVANRAIHLVGSKFLPFGLMAEHASQDIKIDLNEPESDGYAYTSIFDDAVPSSTYYQPWDTSATGKKFVGPPNEAFPSTATNVGSDTFYLLHQGGGVFKMVPVNTDYTGIKMAADGMTIAVGTEYWDAGLRNKDTGHTSPAPDSTIVSGELNIVHESGAKVRIDTTGNVYIDTNGQILYLGDSGGSPQNVVKHGDSTSAHITVNMLGMICYDQTVTPGHTHTVVASQTEVKIP